jgi:hypothetical protein
VVDKPPEKWWKAPPEFTDMVERNREAFKAQFGSFEDAVIERYWLGTSEDGRFLAFQFHRPDGTIHRFAMPGHWAHQFVTEIAAATDEMGGRQLAVALTAVPAKGQA